jgi:membrane fusion protein (multidrug efflux system)
MRKTMSVELDMELEREVNGAAGEKPPAARGLSLDDPRVRRGLQAAAAALVLLVTGLFLYYHWREGTDDAQVDGRITPMASKVYGRVERVLVEDNQAVKAGDPLVRIDPRGYQAAVDQASAMVSLAESEARAAGIEVPRIRENLASGTSSADAQLAAAEADLLRAQAAYDQARTADLAVAQANVERSSAGAKLAQSDLERFQPLAAKGEISKQQMDAARANADASASALRADEQRLAQARQYVEVSRAAFLAAQARVEQAKAAVRSAKSDLRQVSIRGADAQAKLARVEQARAALRAAELQLADTTVLAPLDGVVTRKQVEAGQIVQPGQGLLVIVPLRDVWVTANFKETQLRNMRPGQKAYIEVDMYGKTFTGRVDSIAGATGARLSLLPPENATGNYVKVVQRIPVKILLDPIPQEEAILRPGMNVYATVVTK